MAQQDIAACKKHILALKEDALLAGDSRASCSCHAAVGIDGDVDGGAAAPVTLSSRDLLCGMWPGDVPICMQSGEVGGAGIITKLVASICEPLRLNPELAIASLTSLTVVDPSHANVKVSLRRCLAPDHLSMVELASSDISLRCFDCRTWGPASICKMATWGRFRCGTRCHQRCDPSYLSSAISAGTTYAGLTLVSPRTQAGQEVGELQPFKKKDVFYRGASKFV